MYILGSVLVALEAVEVNARLAGCVSCRGLLGYALAFESLETL